jgi:hypothetical protein
MHVRDVARSTEFYLKALAPLGYGIVMQVSMVHRDSPPNITPIITGRRLRSRRHNAEAVCHLPE